MSTPEERQKGLLQFQRQSATVLLKLWQASEPLPAGEYRSDYRRLLEVALAQALQDATDEQVWSDIARFLGTASSETECIRLIKVLGQTANDRAVAQLLGLLADPTAVSPRVYREIVAEVSTVGGRRYEGRNEAAIHDALAGYINRTDATPTQLAAFDAAMCSIASLGLPESVSTLLRLQEDARLATLFGSTEQREKHFLQLATQFRTAQSVSFLAYTLAHANVNSFEFVFVGEALASVGQPAATTVLLNWAAGARPEDSVFVRRWISMVRDSASLKLVTAAYETRSIRFNEEAAKRAFDEAVETLRMN